VRPITRVSVYGRRQERAVATVQCDSLDRRQSGCGVCRGIGRGAVAAADIVTVRDDQQTPVLLGRWLKRGVFVDLVGSFKPSTREA
jgi:ornithine cyclodeaminase